MVDPTPATPAGGDTPPVPAHPASVASYPVAQDGERPAWAASEARTGGVAAAVPAYVWPGAALDPALDPTADLANWGPPLAPVPPRRSLLQVLWPWGVRGVTETLEVLALALLMFMFVRSLGQNFVVDGGSMEPTFHNGEMLIVNKIVYRSFDVAWLPWSDNPDWRPFGQPRPGDVVVFRFPQNPSRDFIKRVIAVAGQTVEIRNGAVLIDGKAQPEPFLAQPAAYEYGPATVPLGQYFVLGDNRNNSYDSHAWGMLDESYMIGRAELRYWPPDRVGRVDNEQPGAGPQAGVSRSP